ncbi:MAG: hypothetical protein WCE90_09420 [Candidatus Zixiibacteriota bacterium]
MKGSIKVLGLITLCGALFFLGNKLLFTQQAQGVKPSEQSKAEDTTLQETYVSKVIISAPWAKKNLVYDGEESPLGEFGVYQFVVPESLKDQVDAGLSEGPTSFAIAPNGDIYVTDPLNYRIQRFNSIGQFVSAITNIKGWVWNWRTLCVDQDNNIYLTWYDPNKVSVRRYDQAGKLHATYPLLEGRGGPAGTGLYCDKRGRLFFQSYPLSFQFGTTDEVFTPEQQKASLRKGVLGEDSSAEFKLYFKDLTTRQLIQYDSSGNITKRLPSATGELFIGADEEGRIYTESFTYDNKYNVSSFIRKFDEKGNLISTIQWYTAFGSSWGSDYWWGEREIVDKKGSIYIYYSTKEGITITKWYMP